MRFRLASGNSPIKVLLIRRRRVSSKILTDDLENKYCRGGNEMERGNVQIVKGQKKKSSKH